MAALPDSQSYQAPPPAAPVLFDYPQFKICDVPEESGASAAYQGFIRPFSDDATARRVLWAIENERPLLVDGGRLDADCADIPNHRLEDFLIDMAVPFTVLALEFSDSQRPRAYLIDPPMVPQLSACPHLRIDKSIQVGANKFPAMCVYSGTLLIYEDDRSHVEQLLDQTATYLAKYLVWLRTRDLLRRTKKGIELVRKRRPSEDVTTTEASRSIEFFWNGYWPGRSAPSGPVAHLATIRPTDECWCWSGKLYGECCRPREMDFVNKPHRIRLVHNLMTAVHAKLAGSSRSRP